ncbi:heat-shock protein [Stenotrophomonas maltophilia]|uniref:heat-shock protein n=2 Tax=Stenotrophomonas maltophilia TaxID=40324 RepID=UPI0015DF5517|nr:heat-shock protein [Stenotrophomonas maltophilia]MBA0346237.1 heat-shock protein [Stenotrophomonas maltophilia]MBA0357247.1 heat-shock protein [Stenotrophomonas maltophilia]MBA0519192.1 heat-shock protein [Stenotrophomonas maltophilia]
MNRALDALGLDTGADERAIKRAYAQKLRTARPDEDPMAFQALHEACQEALQWVRNRAQWQEEDGAEALSAPPADNSPAGPLAPCDSHSPMDHMPEWHHPCTLDTDMPDDVVEQSLNLPRFARLLIHTAVDADPASFEHWLAHRPELWSLADRPRIGDLVLQQLLQQGGPLCESNFDLLGRYFGWNEIRSDTDPYRIRARRNLLHRQWQLQPRNHTALTAALDRPQDRVSATEAHARVERLTRPWHWLQSLLSASVPGRAATMRQTMQRLGVHGVRDTLAPLDGDQVAFWMAISQPGRFNLMKMQVAIVRCLLGALVVLAVMAALALLGDAARPIAISTSSMKHVAVLASVVIVSGVLMLTPFIGTPPSRTASTPASAGPSSPLDGQGMQTHGPRPRRPAPSFAVVSRIDPGTDGD